MNAVYNLTSSNNGLAKHLITPSFKANVYISKTLPLPHKILLTNSTDIAYLRMKRIQLWIEQKSSRHFQERTKKNHNNIHLNLLVEHWTPMKTFHEFPSFIVNFWRQASPILAIYLVIGDLSKPWMILFALL